MTRDEALYAMLRDGMSYQEIADETGLSLSGVRGMISRARTRAAQAPRVTSAYADTAHDDAPRWDAAKRRLETLGRPARVVLLSDIHLPDQDDRALSLALQITRHVAPDCVVLNGDTLDMAAISRWGESRHAGKRDVLTEINTLYRRLIDAIERAAPDAVSVFVGGNHDDDRMDRIADDYWQFADTIEARYAEIIRAGGRVIWSGYRKEIVIGGLYIQHGTRANETTAKLALRDLGWGLTHIQGHTHRPDMYTHVMQQPTGRRIVQSVVTGCLCNIPPQYTAKQTNMSRWVHGMAVAHVAPQWVNVQPIVFHPVGDALHAAFGGMTFNSKPKYMRGVMAA